jgi:hypothetical protein
MQNYWTLDVQRWAFALIQAVDRWAFLVKELGMKIAK